MCQYTLTNITDLCSCNGVNEPEFRLTEIKSSMRFWFRALWRFKSYDESKKIDEISEMKEVEEELFGNTAHKSPITFRIVSNDFTNIEYGFGKHLVGYNKDKKRPSNISCFLSKNEFIFNIYVFKRMIDENKKIDTDKLIELYDSLLKLSLILGGIGKRSRRGCGVFKINDVIVEKSEDIVRYIVDFMKCLGIKESFEVENNNENYKYFRIKRRDAVTFEYPYVEEILICKECISEEDFYTKIKTAIDNTRKDNLGYNTRGRLACPIYVTCYGDINKLYPIIVKLHNTNISKNYDKYYAMFKEAILCQKD